MKKLNYIIFLIICFFNKMQAQDSMKGKAYENPAFYKSGIGVVTGRIFIKRDDEYNMLYFSKTPCDPIVLYKGKVRGSLTSEIIEVSFVGDDIHVKKINSIPSKSKNIIIEYTRDSIYILDFKDQFIFSLYYKYTMVLFEISFKRQ